MKPVRSIDRVAAFTVALSVTLSTVWAMATLAYPQNASASAQLASAAAAYRACAN
jgi:hypothetical protein